MKLSEYPYKVFGIERVSDNQVLRRRRTRKRFINPTRETQS